MSKNYFPKQGFVTVPNATKFIVKKYEIMDRGLEGKIYRSILRIAHNGEFRARKYNGGNGRMWEIGEEVIPFIEEQFNLTYSSTNKEDDIQITTESDDNTLNVIKTLVNSCLKNILTKEQAFDIIANLLVNNDNK